MICGADAPRHAQSLRFGMFGASRILRMRQFSIRVVNYVYVTRESCRTPDCNTLEHVDCSITARPTPFPPPTPVDVITQQYYSAIFVSSRFHAGIQKFEAHFENVISFYLFIFLNYEI
jgi:hypothetical protein